MRKEKLIKINLLEGDMEHEFKMVEATEQIPRVISEFINEVRKAKNEVSTMVRAKRNWRDGSVILELIGYEDYALVIRNLQMAELTAELKKAGVKFD